MPIVGPENRVRKFGEWMTSHRRIMYAIFLALAGLNGWLSYLLFDAHPILASANAVMAALLAVFVVCTWPLN